ncbi:MAG: VWA domain-containing protein [Sandaracinaceae bacterium]|nr:VWA domain-containing protein [Sandaracinaceae bacterium]
MLRSPTLVALAGLPLLFLAPTAHAIGYLVPTRPDIEPLAIRYHRVTVSIRERVAETRIEQAFLNHTSETLEATYVFPIPEGATVSGFALWIDGRRQEGELLASAQARQIYEQIVRRMQDPGLVEHLGGNLLRARVFPIAPGSEQRLEIRFTSTLDYRGSVVHYRYPLRTSGRAAATLQDFTLSADLVSRTPIRAIYSPSHTISISRSGEHRATIGFEQGRAALDRDFDLYYTVQDSDVGLSLLTHRPPGEDGYFLAMIAPRSEVTEREIAAKEVVFVFDTSGSMAGDKIARARTALDYMLARLSPSDRFQLVRFSTDVEAFFDRELSVPATPENVARARWFANHFVPAGGTAIHPALQLALRSPPRADLPRIVVFLTDGMPTVGETDIVRIIEDTARSARATRLYAFGVGDDVNTSVLDALAPRTGGAGDYFRDGAELEQRMSAFYDRIAYPLLTDLALSFPGLAVYDVYPRDLGHLYRGGQLLVTGRYRGQGESQLRLEGRVAHERDRRAFVFPVAFPPAEPRNEFLPRIWATRKIGFLLDAIRLQGESAELRDEVVQLAQRFGIVTPYTSYLVVEDPSILPPVLARAPSPAPRLPEPEESPPSAGSGGGGGAQTEMDAARDFHSFEQAIMPAPAPDRAPPPRANSGGGGGGGGPAATSVRPPAPRLALPAPAGGQGEEGRRLARRLREMREAERSSSVPSATRFVAGRAFRSVQGAWVDGRYRREMSILRIRTNGDAYFQLLRDRPELRAALALGERVVVTLDERRALVVDPDAPEPSADSVRAFLAGP